MKSKRIYNNNNEYKAHIVTNKNWLPADALATSIMTSCKPNDLKSINMSTNVFVQLVEKNWSKMVKR